MKRIAAIAGEDAAPEAFEPTLALIDRLGLPLEWLRPAVGALGVTLHGDPFPDEARATIDRADATLFGATSGLCAGALRHLRWGKQTFANLRPICFWPGFRSPLANAAGLDIAIVRENLEDLYVACEGDIAALAPLELRSATARQPVTSLGPGRFALKVITEAGSERVARFAFGLARRRKARGAQGKVSCGTKHNMLPQSDGLFRSVAIRVAGEFPDVGFESLIVDDLAHRLVARPHSFDVVLLPNLYGDILSDAAAALVGGLGLAPSGCYGDGYAYFEPAHGTAPDLAGKGTINPTATILSAALMLEYLGFPEASLRLTTATAAVYAEGRSLTPDQGGSASTHTFCEAVAARL